MRPPLVAINGGHFARGGIRRHPRDREPWQRRGRSVDRRSRGLRRVRHHAQPRGRRHGWTAHRSLRRRERSQRILPGEPRASTTLRVERSRRTHGDLVRRRAHAVPLHAFGPATGGRRSRARPFIRDLGVAESVAAFERGDADFLECGPPIVDRLVAKGAGHLAASMGVATGPVPFSSLDGDPAAITRRPCRSRADRSRVSPRSALAGRRAPRTRSHT